jgi:uncharacterized protein (TIGR03086 family)
MATTRPWLVWPMPDAVGRAHDGDMTDDQRGAPQETVADLIVLGRDREAVAAATRDNQRGEAMDGVQQLDEIIPLIAAVVDQITPDQLDNPTACASFTVTGVLEHMIGGATHFSPAFRGEAAGSAAPLEGELIDRWRRAMAELLSALHSPGAQERTVSAPFGDVPVSVFARYTAFDGLVHGWDLSAATGQPYAPPEPLVAEVDAFIRQLLVPEMRDGDTFAAETEAPPDASPLERLVAFSGRETLNSNPNKDKETQS